MTFQISEEKKAMLTEQWTSFTTSKRDLQRVKPKWSAYKRNSATQINARKHSKSKSQKRIREDKTLHMCPLMEGFMRSFHRIAITQSSLRKSKRTLLSLASSSTRMSITKETSTDLKKPQEVLAPKAHWRLSKATHKCLGMPTRSCQAIKG